MRIRDWSSDVCSSDLAGAVQGNCFTVHCADVAAGLTDNDHAGRVVPGGKPALPEAVEAAGCHVGEVEGGRAPAADAGGARHHGVDLAEEQRAVALAGEGGAGGDQALVQAVPRGNPEAAVVVDRKSTRLNSSH